MADPTRARELAEAGLRCLDAYESAARAGIEVPDRIRQARLAFEGAAEALQDRSEPVEDEIERARRIPAHANGGR